MKTSAKAAGRAAVEATPYQSRVAFLLGAISNLVAAGGSRLSRRAFKFGLGEMRLMYVLGYEGVLTARQASRIIGVDKGAMSRTVAALERRGLLQVTVDGADARQRVIQFTPSGRKLNERVMALALERESQMYAIFSEDELHTLSELLKRFHAHVPTVRTPKPVPFPEPTAKPGQTRNRRADTQRRRKSRQ
jgi:DNA-binding MarR family transcriptional regulator